MDPLQNRTFCPVITRFHLYFTPNLTGCCGKTMHTRAFPFTGLVRSQLQSGWVRVCSVPKKDMELLALSVLYLQGSNAGQKYFKI